MTRKQLFLLGARHSIPVCLGYVSVGTAYAVMAAQAGYKHFEILLMSMICYSGSGQFFAVTQAKEHSSLIAISLGLIILNFRYFIMSTCVFARFDKLSNFRRAFFSHFITDEPFAIFTTAKKELISSSYFAGLFFVSWTSWITGAVIGVFASDLLPLDLVLAMNIALYALFIAIVIPAAKSNRVLMAIIVIAAVLNIILSQFIDSCWAILCTIIICSLGGAFFTKD
ncbi:MAG: AzlC family ABC transporter permease, partial [Succinivibrio sp.]